MSRTWTLLLLAPALFLSCNRDHDKAHVEAAIRQRLQTSTGLDLNSLDVTTTGVTFDKDLAYATVSFHPKDDPRINSGLTMKYTLQYRDGKWVVTNVADTSGHKMPGSTSNLPPGHPAVGGSGTAQ